MKWAVLALDLGVLLPLLVRFYVNTRRHAVEWAERH